MHINAGMGLDMTSKTDTINCTESEAAEIGAAATVLCMLPLQI